MAYHHDNKIYILFIKNLIDINFQRKFEFFFNLLEQIGNYVEVKSVRALMNKGD